MASVLRSTLTSPSGAGHTGIVVGRGTNGARLMRGAWNTVLLRLELNDPGVANGLLEFAGGRVCVGWRWGGGAWEVGGGDEALGQARARAERWCSPRHRGWVRCAQGNGRPSEPDFASPHCAAPLLPHSAQ